MFDPVVIVNKFGGVATREQILAGGCSGTDITRAVRLGQLRRIRRARYASAEASLDAIVAARVGGMLAGPSAARSYGLWGGLDTRLHVSVADNASRLRTAVPPSAVDRGEPLTGDLIRRTVRLHWLQGGGVRGPDVECWRVTLETSLKQVVAWCDPETALACLDTAIEVGGLTSSQLAMIFSDASPAHQALVARARAGSQSGTESLARQGLESLGVEVEQQFEVPGVGHVDLRIVGSKVVIEIDSSFHDTPEARVEDARRNRELVAQGYVVVRLRYEEVVGDWEGCVSTIFFALTQGEASVVALRSVQGEPRSRGTGPNS